MELLLDYGADPSAAAKNGYSPLSIAVKLNDMEAVKILISAGADVNQQVIPSQTLLNMAVENRNSSIASILRRNNVRFNYHPNFGQFGLGTECDWNADDIMWNFHFLVSETKYNLNLWTGGGFRPSPIRVLENHDEPVSNQYWERRGNLFLSLDKSVFFYHGKQGWRAGVYGRLKSVYTFGNYRGSNEKPDDKFLIAPGIGISLDGRSIRFNAGYEYFNAGLYKKSPHCISLSLSLKWNRKKDNFRPSFINWY
jgi:hypothetical protein